MACYFLDTEFIEDGKTIDLISIGIVAEDGREYYALNYDCDLSKASQWVKQNVLKMIPEKPLISMSSEEEKRARKQGWRNRDEIAIQIEKDFMNVEQYGVPEIWGEWCSYDWVAFCQLFGTMMELPEGFPMRCRDIIQYAEDHLGIPSHYLPASLETEGNHHALLGAKTVQKRWEFLKSRNAINNLTKLAENLNMGH